LREVEKQKKLETDSVERGRIYLLHFTWPKLTPQNGLFYLDLKILRAIRTFLSGRFLTSLHFSKLLNEKYNFKQLQICFKFLIIRQVEWKFKFKFQRPRWHCRRIHFGKNRQLEKPGNVSSWRIIPSGLGNSFFCQLKYWTLCQFGNPFL
jgi:hypothetical protein